MDSNYQLKTIMIMKRFYLLSITLIMLFLFCGCSKDSEESTPEGPSYADQIIGAWGSGEAVYKGDPGIIDLFFFPNGTFSYTWTYYGPGAWTTQIEVEGTYYLNEKKKELTMVIPPSEILELEDTKYLYFRVSIDNKELALYGNASDYLDREWKFRKRSLK